MKANVPAPTKLSEAIRMALKDQLAVEKIPGMGIEMESWHDPHPRRGGCDVCFAGAVMHQRFDLCMSKRVAGDNIFILFGAAWQRVFMALNSVRNGNVDIALDHMGVHVDGTVEDVYVEPYCNSRAKFRKAMRGIATMLEEKGL